jgi:L-ascorbate 6-phosphate lactonase
VDIHLDFLISTHDHGDHFDVGSIRQFVNSKTKTKIIGPGSVIEAAEKMNFDPARLIKLDRGDNLNIDGLDLTGVFADHGSSSTDCIGVIICLDKKNIYFTSDTCYRPDLPNLVYFKNPVDLLIVPINGKYGNPDSKDAFYIASWVKPKTAIPSHFWLFKEHGGDPGLFAEHCKVIADEVRILVPAIGEKIII